MVLHVTSYEDILAQLLPTFVKCIWKVLSNQNWNSRLFILSLDLTWKEVTLLFFDLLLKHVLKSTQAKWKNPSNGILFVHNVNKKCMISNKHERYQTAVRPHTLISMEILIWICISSVLVLSINLTYIWEETLKTLMLYRHHSVFGNLQNERGPCFLLGLRRTDSAHFEFL